MLFSRCLSCCQEPPEKKPLLKETVSDKAPKSFFDDPHRYDTPSNSSDSSDGFDSTEPEPSNASGTCILS